MELGPKRVMIVDDVEAMRALARFSLEADGRWVVVGEAVDGAGAIEMAAFTQPDLVLLDLEMPWLDGAEALPHIRRVAPSCLVVVWTADPYGHRARGAMGLGACAVLGKGLTTSKLFGEELARVIRDHALGGASLVAVDH
jgi:DNA-binding NarL/FixJ family response regulator